MRQAVLAALIVAGAALSVRADDATSTGWTSTGRLGQRVETARLDDAPKMPPAATPSRKTIEKSIQRGVDFLVKRQNPNGSWGSAHQTKGLNIFAPAPGAHHAFRAGTSALCLSALIETNLKTPEVEKAIERGEEWMFETIGSLRRATPEAIYNNWGHAYAIHALADMLRRKPKDADRVDRIKTLMAEQIDLLRRYECVDGGWAYYDFVAHTQQPSGSSISFVSAAALVSLYEAKQAGVETPPKIVHRAIDSIRRQRKPDFSYFYGEYLKARPMHEVNRPAGSLGRSQACNLAMRLWGDTSVTDEVVKNWLDRLFARDGWLDVGRKRPIPHESWFKVAGYFFYFGHYYAGRCIELLPKDDRGVYQDHLAVVLLDLQEKDGSWWDFPLYDYHQQYGTGFALMSLLRCLRH